MSRILSHLFSKVLLAVVILTAGTIVYAAYTHSAFAQAAGGTYAWQQVWPAPGTPDGPGNLNDVSQPCQPSSTCNWSACGPGYPTGAASQCDSDTCSPQGYQYAHSYQCQYTPPPAATCTPDSSCAANTCTTSTCQGTNADCTQSTVTGTKTCLIPPPTCADLGETGTYPNCTAPAPGFTCADFGEVGTYPNCSAPAPTCAAYSLQGTYPNCTDAQGDVCSVNNGVVACNQNPVFNPAPTCEDFGEVGIYPNCSAPSGGAGSCSNPAVTITAVPSRVKSSQAISLTVNGSGINTSCVVTDEKGVTVGTANAASCSVNSTITTPTVSTQKTYTASCDSGTTNASTAKVIVNLNPAFNPF